MSPVDTVNRYMIAFPFKGYHITTTIDANYIANLFITRDTDCDFYDDDLFPVPTFKVFEKEFNKHIDYEIELKDNGKLNVSCPSRWLEREDLEGRYVEKDIPWILLKVDNKSLRDDIYNITDSN